MGNVSVEGLVEELMSCSDTDLDDRVRALELERRRVEAELALTAGEIDRRRSYLDDGHRSLQAYLRGTCSYSDAEAARVRRLSAAADGVPGLADALRDGRIGSRRRTSSRSRTPTPASVSASPCSPRCCSNWPSG